MESKEHGKKAQLKWGPGDSDTDCTRLWEAHFPCHGTPPALPERITFPRAIWDRSTFESSCLNRCTILEAEGEHGAMGSVWIPRKTWLITTPPLPPVLHPAREAGLHVTGIIFSTSKLTNMQITISRMLLHFPSQDVFASSTKEMFLVFVRLLMQCCLSLGSLNLNTYLWTAMFMPTDMEGSVFSCPFLSALSD